MSYKKLQQAIKTLQDILHISELEALLILDQAKRKQYQRRS